MPLGEDELAAAAEVLRDEARLAGGLDVAVPPEAMARARRRMVAALARPRRPAKRWRHYGIRAAAAAAAAVLLAVIIYTHGPTVVTERPAPPGAAAGLSLNAWIGVVEESAAADEIDMIGRELDELEADLVLFESPAPVELELDAMEKDIENLWLEELSVETSET